MQPFNYSLFAIRHSPISRRRRQPRAGDAVRDRFRKMDPAHGFLAVEIGKRAGDFQHPVIAARRKLHLVGGIPQQLQSRRIRLGKFLDHRGGASGIGGNTRGACRGITLALGVTGAGNAPGDIGTRFGDRRPDKVGGGNGRHVDADIDAVHQRAGNAGLIIRHAARSSGASVTWLTRHTATARIHGRNELDPRRIGDPVIGACDDAFAAFQRLTQGIERLGRKFRKLIEEKHAVMGKRSLARPGAQAAADEGCHGRRMMRRAKRPAIRELAAGKLAGDGMDHRDFQQFRSRKRRQDGGQPRRQHRLAGAGRSDHQAVVVDYVMRYADAMIDVSNAKAYSYVRMSTDTQLKGDSLRRQKEKSAAYAREHGFQLVEDFDLHDIGVSAFRGKNAREGALSTFLAAAKQGLIPLGSYLLVESLDRISRNSPQQATALFLQILQAGINIVTLADGHVYKHDSNEFTDLIVSVVYLARAHEESLTKSMRIAAAWENKRRNAPNTKLTQVCPLWLRLSADRQKYDFIEPNATITRRIFQAAADGKGSYTIARELNQEGISPFGRGNGWHESYIGKILGNRAAFGEYQPHKMVNGVRTPTGDPVEDYFPPLISREQFELVQNGRQSRRLFGAGRKGQNYTNLFQGVMKCGYCDGSVVVINKGPLPKGGLYFRCDDARRGLGCVGSNWPLRDFEASFLTFVKELDLQSILSATPRGDEIKFLEGEKAVKESEIKQLEIKRERAFNLIEDSDDNAAYVNARLKALGTEISVAQDELAKIVGHIDAMRMPQPDSAFDIQEHIQGIQSRDDNQREARTKLANWIRTNVESISFKPDGLEDPRRYLSLKLDDAAQKLAQTMATYAAKHGALARDDERFFFVAFKNGVVRSVKVPKDTTIATGNFSINPGSVTVISADDD